MTAGPLHPDNFPAGRDRRLGSGHGTSSLGPSDSSDSGSDLKGAPGLARQVDGFGLDHPPETDVEESFADNTAGPDVGDANLDGDSDRSGTGERTAADRDIVDADGGDIGVDRIESMPLDEGAPEDDDELPSRH
ncbi:MAG TPA: hypothetical protein VEC19_08925 [Usitatibacter sp.]|nr:hypothetical protein [Usitatibacter sp.]